MYILKVKFSLTNRLKTAVTQQPTRFASTRSHRSLSKDLLFGSTCLSHCKLDLSFLFIFTYSYLRFFFLVLVHYNEYKFCYIELCLTICKSNCLWSYKRLSSIWFQTFNWWSRFKLWKTFFSDLVKRVKVYGHKCQSLRSHHRISILHISSHSSTPNSLTPLLWMTSVPFILVALMLKFDPFG